MKRIKGETCCYYAHQSQLTIKLSPHLLDVPQIDQAPALAGRLDDLGVGVETLGEVLVTAALPAGTHLRVALVLQHAVQTLGLEPARPLVRRLAVTLGDLRDVCGVDLNPSEGFVDLTEAKTQNCIHLFMISEPSSRVLIGFVSLKLQLNNETKAKGCKQRDYRP